jgi:type IV pilus assembly protein PilB
MNIMDAQQLSDIDPSAMRGLNANQVRHFKAMPVALNNGRLKVIVADPSAASSAGQILASTGKESDIFLVCASDLDMAIEQLPAIEEALQPKADAEAEAEIEKPVSFVSKAPKRRKKDQKWDPDNPAQVADFVAAILVLAADKDASDIHIERYQSGARLRFRLNGKLEVINEMGDFLNGNFNAVVARLKLMANCDIAEKRLAQDGALAFDYNDESIDVRFSSLPTKFGESLVMRLLRGDPSLSIDKIGFPPEDLDKLIKAIHSPQGMVLVTGPTGSGKTTTLYGCLQWINSPDKNIMTAEDPVEYTLDGVRQTAAREDIGLSFSNILRAFLRQDPEVILVGEIRDKETADIAIKAALTGHLLLSTLHTNSSIATLQRLGNMGIPNYMLAAALSVIVAQRLARKNCAKCLVDDKRATQEVLTYIGFDEYELSEFKPKCGQGCDACGQSGFKGRQGIYELLQIDRDVEQAILAGNTPAHELEEIARQNGFKTMQEIGRDFIRKGVLSVEEYQNVITVA